MSAMRGSNKYEILRDLALLSSLSYNAGTTAFNFVGFDKVDLIDDKDTCTQVYVVSNADCIVCVFRGTKGYKDYFTDFKLWMKGMTPFPHPFKAHAGFVDSIDSVWDRLRKAILSHGYKRKSLYMTGHSLGGALATLASTHYPSAVVATFGSPKVFNRYAAVRYCELRYGVHYRVVKAGDFITLIPNFFRAYRHVKGATLIYLCGNGCVLENPTKTLMTAEHWRDLISEFLQCNIFKTEDHDAFEGYYSDLVRICHTV